MEISYLKRSNYETVIKVFGSPGTINLNLTDLVTDNEAVSLPKVNLIGVSWTGSNDSEITISRNNQVLLTLPGTGANYINFSGDSFTPDIINNTHNFTINMVGTQGQVWLRLRKLEGYFAYIYTSTKYIQDTTNYNDSYKYNSSKRLDDGVFNNDRVIYEFNPYIDLTYFDSVYIGNPIQLSNSNENL